MKGLLPGGVYASRNARTHSNLSVFLPYGSQDKVGGRSGAGYDTTIIFDLASTAGAHELSVPAAGVIARAQPIPPEHIDQVIVEGRTHGTGRNRREGSRWCLYHKRFVSQRIWGYVEASTEKFVPPVSKAVGLASARSGDVVDPAAVDSSGTVVAGEAAVAGMVNPYHTGAITCPNDGCRCTIPSGFTICINCR